MEPVSQYPHPFTTSLQVAKSWSAQFPFCALVDWYHQQDGWWMFKHDSNSWFSGPYPFSKRRTPVCFDAWGKGQLDIVELATCFLELGDSEAALGRTLPLYTLVYITRPEIGFFGIFTFFLVDWEHILLMGLMWLFLSSLDLKQEMLEPSEAAMAAIGRGIAGGNWPTISYDGLLSKSIRILWQNQNIVLHFLHFFLTLSLDSGGQPDVHLERQSNKQNSFSPLV